MQDTEIIERIVTVEAGLNAETKRIDVIETKVENIYDLTMSVKEIATEMKAMREDVSKMDNRLNILEEKPLKDYEETKSQIKKQVVSFFVGIVLTVIAFALGLNKFL